MSAVVATAVAAVLAAAALAAVAILLLFVVVVLEYFGFAPVEEAALPLVTAAFFIALMVADATDSGQGLICDSIDGGYWKRKENMI